MNHETSNETTGTEEGRELLARRLFLRSMGKWSGAAIAAALFGGAWLASPPEASAGGWVNRRGGGRWRGLGQSCRWGRRGLDKRWRWGMGQPPWLWRRRCMGQSLIGDLPGTFAWRRKPIGLSGSCHERPNLQRHPPSDLGLQRRVRLLLRAQGAAPLRRHSSYPTG
jgi:hypothetical protein